MTDRKGYYKVLGLEPTATQEQIRDAYYLHFINHYNPSQNLSQEERQKYRMLFQKANRAYAVLSDQELKDEYDQEFDSNNYQLQNNVNSFFDNMHNHFHTMYNNFNNVFRNELRNEQERFNELLRENENNHESSQNNHFERRVIEETRVINGKKNTTVRELNNDNGNITEKVTKIDENGNKTEKTRLLSNKNDRKQLN